MKVLSKLVLICFTIVAFGAMYGCQENETSTPLNNDQNEILSNEESAFADYFKNIDGKEIIENRTENSKTFLLHNGQYLTRFTTNPVHSKNENGLWVDISKSDLRLLKSSSLTAYALNTLRYKYYGAYYYEAGVLGNVGRYDGYKGSAYYSEEVFRASVVFSGLSAIYPNNTVSSINMTIWKNDPFGGVSTWPERYGSFRIYEFSSYDYIGSSTHWNDCADGTLYETFTTSSATLGYTPFSFNRSSGSLYAAVVNAIPSDKFGVGIVSLSESSTGGLMRVPYATLDIVYTVTLTTSVNPAGSGSVSPSGTTVQNGGSTVNVIATPISGWRFKNWSGSNNSTSSPVSMSLTKNATLTANFELVPKYTVSTTVNPSGSGSITFSTQPGADGKFEEGTQLTLTAIASAGWQFYNWSGSGSTSYINTFTVNSNTTQQANFIRTLEINGPVELPANGSATYTVTTIPEATVYKWYKLVNQTTYPYGTVYQYQSTGTSYLGTMGTGANPYILVLKVEAYDASNNLKGTGIIGVERSEL